MLSRPTLCGAAAVVLSLLAMPVGTGCSGDVGTGTGGGTSTGGSTTSGTTTTVARPLLTPNGVGLSPDGRTLYYAETAGARLWAYDITAPGVVQKHAWPSPNGGRMLAASPGGHLQRFDSLAVDVLGNICVATLMHGGISVISPDGSLVSHVPLPDRMTTNLCFGGPALRTVSVTLSGTGKLVAIDDWPIPGLALNHNA